METTPLTDAERRCLGNIIGDGGSRELTQGRHRTGALRKSVVSELVRRGLVCGESLACAYQRGGVWYPATVYYATAAGCIAYGPVIAIAA